MWLCFCLALSVKSVPTKNATTEDPFSITEEELDFFLKVRNFDLYNEALKLEYKIKVQQEKIELLSRRFPGINMTALTLNLDKDKLELSKDQLNLFNFIEAKRDLKKVKSQLKDKETKIKKLKSDEKTE